MLPYRLSSQKGGCHAGCVLQCASGYLKQKFYAAHEADFIINDAAKRQLDKLGAPKQLPKRKEVVAEIQSLISEKNECYNDYREKSDRLHELMTMQRNYQMAMPQPKRGRSHEQER